MGAKLSTPLADVNFRLGAIDWADPDGLTDAMAILFDAMARTSGSILQNFGDYSEALLHEGSMERAARLAIGDVRIAGLDEKSLFLDAARWLRTIEEIVLDDDRYIESNRGCDLEDAWRTSDGEFFVIPRLNAKPAEDGKTFVRRALRYHRIVPAIVDGLTVRLERMTEASDRETRRIELTRAPRSFGAAFFPDLSAAVTFPEKGRFLVSDVGGFNADTRLAEHVDEAYAAKCYAVVWPELTMPDQHIETLQRLLGERALDSLWAPRYLVAGSWHREREDGYRNICPVLDGSGSPLFEVTKWARFKFDGNSEAIIPGDEVPILVGDNELSVIAVCRDFLEMGNMELPYSRLHVDVAIVPSMTPRIGDLQTMRGHASIAKIMRVRYDTRTMVVAQPATAKTGAGVGRVMDFPDEPPTQQNGLIVRAAWRLCLLKPS